MSEKKIELYQLSKEADADLDTIFDYTANEHGTKQAVSYLTDLENHFKQLVLNPNLGRERSELRKGIYSLATLHHITFYSKQKNFILIVRVLHSRREIPKFLE